MLPVCFSNAVSRCIGSWGPGFRSHPVTRLHLFVSTFPSPPFCLHLSINQDASVYAACMKQLMSRGGPAGPLVESTHDSLAWLKSLGNRGVASLLQVRIFPPGLD